MSSKSQHFHLSAKSWSLAFLALGLAVTSQHCTAHADDPVFSGPQVGEKLPPLQLQGVFDEAAGKEFDPVAQAEGKPLLLVFVHKITRPGLGLARGVTSYAESLKDTPTASAVVWLDDDKANAEQYLNKARKSLNLTVPVGIAVDGAEGPGSYGLNRNVELTVLVAHENKVVANFALVQPSMTDGVKIAGELAKVLGKTPPTAEELMQVAFPGRQMDMRRRTQRGAETDSPRRQPTPRDRSGTVE